MAHAADKLFAERQGEKMIGFIVNFLGLIVGAIGLTAAAMTHIAVRRRRRQLELTGVCGTPAVLNLSAHPLAQSEEGWLDRFVQFHHPVELDMASAGELEASLVEVIKGLPEEVRQRLQAADPNLVVAFPAPRGAVSLLEPMLHGLVGEFVRTTWSVRTPAGFVWVKPVDRQAVRLRSRAALRGV